MGLPKGPGLLVPVAVAMLLATGCGGNGRPDAGRGDGGASDATPRELPSPPADQGRAEPAVEAEPALTYADLIYRLIDLEALSLLPQPGEVTAQWSSYDRASYYDDEAGEYVGWDANGDSSGFLHQEGDYLVLGEMEGPGVIWRIWTAMPLPGEILLYLDDAPEPAMVVPFWDLFLGKTPPFVYPNLVYGAAKGQNSYVPISFSKSCRILANPAFGLYYHFTYSAFPEGTVLPRFSTSLPDDAVLALEAVDEFFANNLGEDPAGQREGQEEHEVDLVVEPGETKLAFELEGTGAITAVKVVMGQTESPTELVSALREVVLQIFWDGAAEPAVWAPLGDFFGNAPGYAPFRTLVSGMTEEGYYSFWHMPFGDGARVELVNDGPVERALHLELVKAPLARPVEEYGRFHAKWHRNAFPPDEPGREIDWTMLTTEGRGRYVGTMLHIWNPGGGWWGEGDEKLFVDGELFPSTFGTGSEDYFGYAWCTEELFSRAFHAQPVSVAKNQCQFPDPADSGGHTCNSRWHIVDSVPFQTSFEASIEKYFSDEKPTLYANTVYWYLEPGGTDPYPPVPLEERLGYFD